VGIVRDRPKFLGYPLLTQERVKLRTSNLAGTFIGCIRLKPFKRFGEKGAWAYSGTAEIFGVPLLSRELVKLRTSNFVHTFIVPIETKAHENFGKSSRGSSQGVWKIFREPLYMGVHCAVIFAIAQLSC